MAPELNRAQQKLKNLIKDSLLTEEEQEAWIKILPQMNADQIEKFSDILEEERVKITQLNAEYDIKLRVLKEAVEEGYAQSIDQIDEKIDNLIRQTASQSDGVKLQEARKTLEQG